MPLLPLYLALPLALLYPRATAGRPAVLLLDRAQAVPACSDTCTPLVPYPTRLHPVAKDRAHRPTKWSGVL